MGVRAPSRAAGELPPRRPWSSLGNLNEPRAAGPQGHPSVNVPDAADAYVPRPMLYLLEQPQDDTPTTTASSPTTAPRGASSPWTRAHLRGAPSTPATRGPSEDGFGLSKILHPTANGPVRSCSELLSRACPRRSAQDKWSSEEARPHEYSKTASSYVGHKFEFWVDARAARPCGG